MADLNEQSLVEEVLSRKKPALVKFWAPWCLYSLLLRPKREALERLFGGRVMVSRLNVDEHLACVKSPGIEFVPGLASFNGGRLVQKWYSDLALRAVVDVVAGYESLNA
jgi:thioredoxin-like negative regulator of GroEL